VGLSAAGGKLTTIGKISLDLVNFTHNGEKIFFSWEKTQPSSQQIKLNTEWPYIYGLPVGFGFDFFAQKIDTLEFNLNYNVKFAYFTDGLNRIYLGYLHENNFTSLTSQNTQTLRRQGAVFSAEIAKAFPQKNPQHGYQLHLNLSYGRKNWADSSAFQLAAMLRSQLFVPLGQKLALRLAANAFTMSSSRIFENEQLYLGGNDNFRGFLPNSFRGWQYWLVTMEPRLLFEQWSNAFVFIETGKIFQIIDKSQTKIQTLAFGLGFNLKTKNSLLSLTYAVGRTNNQPFNPAQGKIHLGYKLIF
jgi:hypothetical protein